MTNHAWTTCKPLASLLAALILIASCGLDLEELEETTAESTTTTAESTTTTAESTTTTAESTTTTAESTTTESTVADTELPPEIADEIVDMALVVMVTDRWPELGPLVRQRPEVFIELGEAICNVAYEVDSGTEMGMAALYIYYSEIDGTELGDVITSESQFAELVGISAAAAGCSDRLNELNS